MLVLPELVEYYRVVAIDPGTDTLGVAILDVDLHHGVVNLVDAFTLRGNTNSKKYPMIIESHGLRYAKIHSHAENLLAIFSMARPHAIICESPFLGRFAQAFEALVECKMMIRHAVQQYDPTMTLETIDPPSAKIAVGASGGCKDKTVIRDNVAKLGFLKNPNNISILDLDEHSTDAIAVGIYKCRQVLDWVERSN